jgi:hypothetical protein
MKARHQVDVRRGIGAIEAAPSYHAESSPNSSAILAVTVLADTEDVLAVIRTAILLGNSFKASTSVHVFGEDAIHIESGEHLSQASLAKFLDVTQGKLCRQGSSQAPLFTVEASITAASFLAAGTISVHIRGTDSVPKWPTVAR